MCRPPPPALVLQQSKEAVVDEAVLLLPLTNARRCSINRARAFLRLSVCSSLIIASHGPSLTE